MKAIKMLSMLLITAAMSLGVSAQTAKTSKTDSKSKTTATKPAAKTTTTKTDSKSNIEHRGAVFRACQKYKRNTL